MALKPDADAQERMLLPDHPYAVVLSQTLYRWLVYRAVAEAKRQGHLAWNGQGRTSFSRVETLAYVLRTVRIQQRGRLVQLTQRQARTAMGLCETWRALGLQEPPASARSFCNRLAYRLGDLKTLPGRVRSDMKLPGIMVVSRGQYVIGGLDDIQP